ncbi:sensor histidine kinase [Paramaledivibacter caminithermalis]|uniref:sensor histidine kinase n=1 Tax=Paramaledivibacter caminithermalis TaxID=191027 RepID=UPI0013F4EE6A|nr:HAMP domain-containing sensor histidine kinase [Paramaledivibacter caminithermalis]
MTFVIASYSIKNHYDVDLTNINESIDTYGPKKAFQIHKLPKGSYIEILDSRLTVINQYKSIHNIGYTYPQANFNKLALNYTLGYELHYSTEKDTINLIYISDYSEVENVKFFKRLYIYILIFFIISVLVVLLIYAKLTSRTLVRPIKKILEGVKTISEGDYSSRINYKSKNELGYLIKSINQMSEKIQHEIDLREKSEEKRKKLLLDISHDLKTPLTNILGYSETLRYGNELEEDLRNKYLDIIISNSKKANNLIQDLFELSHMENNNCDIKLEEHDFSEFIREILVDYIPELDENHIDCCFDIPDKEIIIKMNSQKLERAINNIIDNSIKYSEKNAFLKLRLEDSNNEAVLTIEDNGVGIPCELAECIFDPFVRADNSRNSKTGGTGLGLAISKEIIKIHGGGIELDTSYKDGCRFVITLPKTDSA